MTDKLVELIAKYFKKLNPNSNYIIATQLAGYLRNNGVTLQRWIPVSERLPKERGKYLVWGEISVRDKIYHFADVQVFSPDLNAFVMDGIKSDYITHWMPIEPPKEGE
jgi:hypothetical protein